MNPKILSLQALRLCMIVLLASALSCDTLVGVFSPGSDSGPASTEAARGARLYASPQITSSGGSSSCAQCHGTTGTGGSAPAIRGEAVDHLITHAQAGGPHPEGVKYPNLTEADFVAMTAFLGGDTSTDHHDDNGSDEPLIGDPVRGQEIFNVAQVTTSAGRFSCANCHAADGSSAFGPDVRGQPADHLISHAQGGGRHPAGVQFPDLTDQDFADMAAFLGGDHHEEDEHAEGGEHAKRP